MSPLLAHEVMAEVRRKGFAVVTGPCTEGEFLDLAWDLGEVVDDTTVRVVPGKETYLAGTDPIPLHMDHPVADLVAWRCEAQDPVDGASILVDGRAVLSSLAPECASALRTIRLPAAIRSGTPITTTPILSAGEEPRLFFAPWLEPIKRRQWMVGPLTALRAALTSAVRTAPQVRLAQGQVLLVDNHRLFHGRAGLMSGSPRLLRRLWVRA